MRTHLTKRLVAVLMCSALFMAQFPTDALAGFKKKEHLPGLVSTKSIVLIGVGTAAAVFLITKLSRSGKDSKSSSRELRSAESQPSNSPTPASQSQVHDLKAASTPRVAPLLLISDDGMKGIDSLQRNMNLKNKTVSLGLSVGF